MGLCHSSRIAPADNAVKDDGLQDAEDVFQMTFASSPVGLIMCEHDPSGTMLRINRAAYQTFGYDQSSNELRGKGVDILLPVAIRQAHAALRTAWASKPLARPMNIGHEVKGIRKDGSEVPLEVGLAPVTIKGQRYVLATVVDQTYRLQAAALAKSAAEAHAASKARGDTLSTMSHEIRNPLNGVIGTAALLLDACTTDEQRSLAHTIAACGEATLAIVNDILDWSKIDAGRMTIECIPFSIAEVIKQVVDIMRTSAEDKGISLEAMQCDGLGLGMDGTAHCAPAKKGKDGRPHVLPGVRVLGDPTRVRQIVLNFVSNAVKFVPTDGSGGVTIKVGVRPLAPESFVPTRQQGLGTLWEQPADSLSARSEPTTARQDPQSIGLSTGSVGQAVGACQGLGTTQLPMSPSLIHVRGQGAITPVPEEPARPALGSDVAGPYDSTGVEEQSPPPCATHELVISVIDNGSGIAPETQAMLFRPFTQASASTARKYGGTGLGLSICKALTDLMGGSIELESAPGRGSCFRIRLPTHVLSSQSVSKEGLSSSTMSMLFARPGTLGTPAAATNGRTWTVTGTSSAPAPGSPTYSRNTARSPTAASAATSVPLPPLSGVRVLLVDDNAVNRRIASALLMKLGCIVETAVNGDDALKAWQRSCGQTTGPGAVEAAADTTTAGVQSASTAAAAVSPTSGGLASPPAGVVQSETGTSPGQSILPPGPRLSMQPTPCEFDVILMDCQMPVMDGFEATRAIRQQEAGVYPHAHRTRIVALTASAMPEDHERCTAAGMDGYVTKPIRMKDLQTAIQDVLRPA